jgi:hypothetical protein
MSPNAGGGKRRGCGVLTNECSCAQINLGDLTPYLTYDSIGLSKNRAWKILFELNYGQVFKDGQG